MNRKVLIMDDAGKVVTIYEIYLRVLNYVPADHEWFDIAWENAVKDEVVIDKNRVRYKLSFA